MAAFIVVDDHPLARLAIRMLLEKEGHVVVAETGNGSDVLALVKNHNTDALVMDIDLPGINGIDAITLLRSAGIKIPVIVMSGKNPDYYIQLSMKAGANGFISKQNNLSDLSHAVGVVFSGYGYFPLRISEHYEKTSTASESEQLRLLSRREFEVLRYLGEGVEIFNIAARMQISNKTVSTYKARLMDKLGLKNQRDLLDFTRRNNIS
ncbi:two-component system, NarL family, response regulator EvgA [Candidatus Pantoea symbiotica]|jgi:two-component system response regulator EvgA|uniref:Two-component system, NarL family, response regulator EvgA n=1 Tax=Candidatus Pantoea symbiotica TaxID=1884370 RepID=A0A1I3YTE0_9GAMM|nr:MULTISPECIES: response regulator [Pantoea]SFK34619.1 two-component system, NarL family, response regulator EvgA [Pantoea symbiotica]SFU87131.1 two-component system, NarL family, response regulator EvgA [Pantoea sp. YR525]